MFFFTLYTTNKQKVDLSQYNTEQKSNFEKIITIKHRHATKTNINPSKIGL